MVKRWNNGNVRIPIWHSSWASFYPQLLRLHCTDDFPLMGTITGVLNDRWELFWLFIDYRIAVRDDKPGIGKTNACFSALHFVCNLCIALQSPSIQQPLPPWESCSCSCSQSELTPRSFCDRPGMFGVAESNWTVTITNGWFSAARQCNAAVNERKHTHQFHTVANTILLWVIVVGQFFIQGAAQTGKIFFVDCVCVCVCVDFLERG